MITATIITIGDEILIGQIVDTNSVSIARRLNAIGITVSTKLSIGDDCEQISDSLCHALICTDVVIITGGLGPTKDDITKHTLAEFFGSELVENKAVAEQVERMLAARGIAFNSLNRSQALVPECCTVLFNNHGTAPGMWFNAEDRVVISLPGVPFEMEHLMEDEVIPRLKSHFSLHANIHRTMITSGIAESMLAERIAQWEGALPDFLKLAYLPSPNIVRLRLSAYDCGNEELTRDIIEREFSKLYDIIPDNIVGFENATVEQLIHQLLCERGLTLATAESCTGGAIASKFTAMAGASAYFRGGVVSYATEVKQSVLGVDADIIDREGVVSEATAKAMAEGARQLMQSDYAIATTGIAGPTGGSDEHPVGEVWMAVASPEGIEAVKRQCGTDRGQIISRATAYAIEMLYNRLKTK